MKATATFLSLILATVMTLHAEQFFLIDESGKQHGPYEITHNGKLILDGQEYRIRIPRIEHREHELFAKMQQCIIPQVDFRQADIRDVVDFLHRASVEFWPDDGTPQRGISVILRLEDDMPTVDEDQNRNETEDRADPFATGGFATPFETRSPQSRPITFSALDISLLQAFEIVCELVGLEMQIRGSVLMLIPAKRPIESPDPFKDTKQP